jgi:hypothetical protein
MFRKPPYDGSVRQKHVVVEWDGKIDQTVDIFIDFNRFFLNNLLRCCVDDSSTSMPPVVSFAGQ